jgi:hypothetical protein
MLVRFAIAPCTTKQQKVAEISGSHGGKYEDDGLLGCCTV